MFDLLPYANLNTVVQPSLIIFVGIPRRKEVLHRAINYRIERLRKKKITELKGSKKEELA